MNLKFNFWLESNEEVVLSWWRIRLLQAVADTGSISAGARQMGVPYRIAWQKIHEMETRLGQSLVDTQVGGPAGGGAQLTPLAQQYLDQFSQLHAEAQSFLQARFQAIFGDEWASGG